MAGWLKSTPELSPVSGGADINTRPMGPTAQVVTRACGWHGLISYVPLNLTVFPELTVEIQSLTAMSQEYIQKSLMLPILRLGYEPSVSAEKVS